MPEDTLARLARAGRAGPLAGEALRLSWDIAGSTARLLEAGETVPGLPDTAAAILAAAAKGLVADEAVLRRVLDGARRLADQLGWRVLKRLPTLAAVREPSG